MICKNPRFNVNLLSFYGAILVLLSDMLSVFITYQIYCDSLRGKTENNDLSPYDPSLTESQRLR